jgi:Arc/MetJ-type ribon-helix-helix transcriptional regulator
MEDDFAAEELILVSVKVTQEQFEGLSELLRRERYSNRSEAIRVAIRDLLQRIKGRY